MHVQLHPYFNFAKLNDILARARSVDHNLAETPSIVEIAQKIILDSYPKEHQWNDCTFIKNIAKLNGDEKVIKIVKSIILKAAPDNLSTLFNELLCEISTHLKPKALVNLSRTCRRLHGAIKAEWIFRQALRLKTKKEREYPDWVRIYWKEENVEQKIKLIDIFFRFSPLDQFAYMPSLGVTLTEKFLTTPRNFENLSLFRENFGTVVFEEWRQIIRWMHDSKDTFQIKNLELKLENFYARNGEYRYHISESIQNFLHFNSVGKVETDDFCSFYEIMNYNRHEKKPCEYTYNFKSFECDFRTLGHKNTIPKFQKELPNVSHLMMQNFPFWWKESFELLGNVFPKIEEIDIQNIGNNDDIMPDFFSHLYNVKVLRFKKLSRSQIRECCELILQKDSSFRVEFQFAYVRKKNQAGKLNDSELKIEDILKMMRRYPDLFLSSNYLFYTIGYKELTRQSNFSFLTWPMKLLGFS